MVNSIVQNNQPTVTLGGIQLEFDTRFASWFYFNIEPAGLILPSDLDSACYIAAYSGHCPTTNEYKKSTPWISGYAQPWGRADTLRFAVNLPYLRKHPPYGIIRSPRRVWFGGANSDTPLIAQMILNEVVRNYGQEPDLPKPVNAAEIRQPDGSWKPGMAGVFATNS